MKKIADIILVNPKGFGLINDRTPPLNFLYSTVYLYKDYDIKIIDQRFEKNWENILLEELRKNPICVGVTSMTGSQLKYALEISKIVKDNSKVPVVWGGVHASLLPNQTIKHKYVDIIVKGEGEVTFQELIKALKEKTSLADVKGVWYKKGDRIIATEEREFVNLSQLPDIPWELIDIKKYLFNGEFGKQIDFLTSKGCPNQCIYCYNNNFNKSKWRAMDSKKTLREIKRLVSLYKIEHIRFQDDAFFVNLTRAREIFEGIKGISPNLTWSSFGTCISDIKRMDNEYLQALEKSGCTDILIGIESGSPKILKYIKKNNTLQDIISSNKRLSKTKIRVTYTYMSGFPNETKEDLKKTIDLFFKLKKDNKNIIVGNIKPIISYPGTEFFNIALKRGLKIPKNLEEWSSSMYGNFENTNIPWMTKQHKKTLTYLYFATVLLNPNYLFINSKMFNIISRIVTPFMRWRVKHLNFNFPIFLFMVKYIYKKIN